MDFSTLLSSSVVFDFIRGPLVWISFIVFFLGVFYQIFEFLSSIEKNEKIFYKFDIKKLLKSIDFKPKSVLRGISKVKLSIVGVNPTMVIVSTVFHICLVVTPIFLLAHNILLDTYIGVSFFSFSEKVTDYMTIVLMGCIIFFLYRRIFVARVKAITSYYDYLMLFIAVAPFVTGFLAYHQIMFEHYKLIISLHILSGEIMLMAIPFTKFVHMTFFFVFRFLLVSEYSLGAGNRVYKTS